MEDHPPPSDGTSVHSRSPLLKGNQWQSCHFSRDKHPSTPGGQVAQENKSRCFVSGAGRAASKGHVKNLASNFNDYEHFFGDLNLNNPACDNEGNAKAADFRKMGPYWWSPCRQRRRSTTRAPALLLVVSKSEGQKSCNQRWWGSSIVICHMRMTSGVRRRTTDTQCRNKQ